MQLSRRLETILTMAGRGGTVADIGTDHGYVPLELIRRGCYEHAIAMDVRKGPLERAEAHVREAGLTDAIELRLSNGFAALKPGEAETAVIAGMGGPLMAQLLQEGEQTARSVNRLVLSPQSEVGDFHQYLIENGYRVEDETWVEDDNKYYVVMMVSQGTEEPWDEIELHYGRPALRRTPGDLMNHLEREIRTADQVLEQLRSLTGESAEVRRAQMQHRRDVAQEAMRRRKEAAHDQGEH